MSTPRTVRLLTLGCKVNQYETQYVKELLEHAGWAEAPEGERAGLCVVNTCTVTHEGDAKSRQAVRRLHQDNPDATVVVMGCYATRDPDAVSRLPGVSHVLTDKDRLVEGLQPFGVTAPLAGISRFDGHQRAFVKVQDGCLLNCSYCIIPSVRPTLRSRPAADIAAEVAGLVEAGYPEVVLTGIHLGHYGLDLSKGRPKAEWMRLWHLIDRLARLQGNFRLRLSSLEAAEARDDLVRVLADHANVCPHLHLCLQSGSDNVLAAMKRRYRRAGFLERVRRLRSALDRPAFTTDIIVGFPGETDADFEDTLAVVREARFLAVHVFTYSPRAGTPAATAADTVSPALKAERRRRLRAVAEEVAQQELQLHLGQVLDVLVEGAAPGRPGWVTGTSCRYAQVVLPGHLPTLLRRRLPVRIVGVENGVLLGEAVQPTRTGRVDLLVLP